CNLLATHSFQICSHGQATGFRRPGDLRQSGGNALLWRRGSGAEAFQSDDLEGRQQNRETAGCTAHQSHVAAARTHRRRTTARRSRRNVSCDYSITSSAMASSCAGTSSPSVSKDRRCVRHIGGRRTPMERYLSSCTKYASSALFTACVIRA